MPELTITGKVIKVLPVESGTSKAGKDWSKQDFVIETDEQYSKKICFTSWKTPVEIGMGDTITVSFDPESREYNDRWYTDLKAWKIEGGSGGQEPIEPDPAVTDAKIIDKFDATIDSESDGLPF